MYIKNILLDKKNVVQMTLSLSLSLSPSLPPFLLSSLSSLPPFQAFSGLVVERKATGSIKPQASITCFTPMQNFTESGHHCHALLIASLTHSILISYTLILQMETLKMLLFLMFLLYIVYY